MFESSEAIKDLAPNMWEYCMECLKHCHRLEELYKKVESSGFNIFPVTVGRRPDIDSPDSSPLQPLQPVGSSTPTDSYIQPIIMSDVSNTQTKSQEQEDLNGVTHGCLNLPPKFPASQAEQTSTLNKSVSSNSSKSSNSRKSGPFLVCKVFVSGTGWASQWSNGEISIHYSDGCELLIEPNPMTVCFTNIRRTTTRFTSSDTLPILVRNKMEDLPVVMEKLEAAQLANEKTR